MTDTLLPKGTKHKQKKAHKKRIRKTLVYIRRQFRQFNIML